MPRQIIIEFEYGSDKSPPFYRGLDFNESLFRLARNDQWTSFPLDQIDETTGQCIGVKTARRLRRVLARIAKLIDEHRAQSGRPLERRRSAKLTEPQPVVPSTDNTISPIFFWQIGGNRVGAFGSSTGPIGQSR